MYIVVLILLEGTQTSATIYVHLLASLDLIDGHFLTAAVKQAHDIGAFLISKVSCLLFEGEGDLFALNRVAQSKRIVVLNAVAAVLDQHKGLSIVVRLLVVLGTVAANRIHGVCEHLHGWVVEHPDVFILEAETFESLLELGAVVPELVKIFEALEISESPQLGVVLIGHEECDHPSGDEFSSL